MLRGKSCPNVFHVSQPQGPETSMVPRSTSEATAPRVLNAIQLAQAAGKGFYSNMGDVHETEKWWSGVGELVLWVAFYFWAVWIFIAFLPPKPEQTPFEAYLKNQIQQQTDGARSGGGQRLDQGSGDQQHHSLLRGRQE